jgi:dienelactone hydrolase
MKKMIFCVFIVTILLFILPIKANEDYNILEPEKPGPYHIGYYKVRYNDPTYGIYKATIRYPAKYNGFCTPKDPENAPYPGIVVANGFAGSEWNIKWIPKHLTTYGYITICFTPPNNLLGDTTQWAYGFIGGIEKLKSQNHLWFSPISSMLDIETFGGIGLSMGGAGCIEATGSISSEFDSSVALAPASSNSSIDAAKNIIVPIQIQVGSNDTMVSPERVLPYYSDKISDTVNKEYLSINGGNHIGFVDEFFARFAEWVGLDGLKYIEFNEQRRISKRYFTSWFQYYLRDLDDYFTYIFGEEAQSDLGEGILSDLRYNIIDI